jgi:diacylglycerol kinase family enzyme
MDSLRLALIVNPFASSYSARRVRIIKRALATAGELTVMETSERGEATALATKAAKEKYDYVFVLAGDGTLNEAAQGLINTETALAPLPGGSTNVFARAIGYSNDAIDALDEVLEAIEKENVQSIGVGTINDRVFLFNAGCGLDAEVIARVERNAKMKKVAAQPLTLSTAVTTYVKDFDRKEQQMRVTLGENVKGVRMMSSDPSVFAEANMVVISNLSPWTFLGQREVVLAPSADISHALTITAIRALSPAKMIRIAASAMGRHKTVAHHKDIAHVDDVHEATIEAVNSPMPYQVDGDYIGTTDVARIGYIPDALRIVMPL